MRNFRRTSKLAATLLAGLAGLVFGGGVALASDLAVPMDEVRMVTFPQPVATVYVGNPMIADVTVIDARRVFVLGKNFGATDLVALDANGNQILDQHVTVLGRTGSTVTLHRGVSQTTFTCAASSCAAAPVPGDDKDTFDAVLGQIDRREAMGAKAAAGGPGQ